MKRRSRIVLAALLVVFMVALSWFLSHFGPSEPVYSGETVSYWLSDKAARVPWMDSNATPFLIKALGSRDGSMHRLYTSFLAKMPDWVTNHLPRPVYAVHVRIRASDALYQIGGGGKPAVPVLIRTLRSDESEIVRRFAALALGRSGNGDQTVTAALVEALKDKDPIVRVTAAQSLWMLDAKNKPAEEAFIEALKDRDASVRSEAAYLISRVGFDANDNELTNALVKALQDIDPRVRANARAALKQMDPLETGKAALK